ncbi:MAG: type III-B CRISPR module-associated protein Cmr3 [Dehalococcoidia bacterium]|nr:type III-B CRISPR module-associated protein Cmr3 [Dehalococcoidia bacterium]MDW8008693.1 type III-B CRISPR module-associated protein Cmr3 [Chloroflexota bacterium]
MELFLEAVDVWLFRDGRPFDAISDHRAVSMFPPYPTVVQGAIRSRHLVVRGVDLHDPKAVERTVGTVDNYGSLRMRGPLIARRESGRIVRYFPLPADLVLDGNSGRYRALEPRQIASLGGVRVSTPSDLSALLWPPEDLVPAKEQPDQWLREDELERYLAGQPVEATPGDRLFTREYRTGIGLSDDTGTTREGMIYHVEFIRPHPGVGLWVQVEGYEGWPREGALSLGGERRAARFVQLEQPLGWPAHPEPLPERFKVYFASPTYFSGGWQPAGGSWARFFSGNGQVRLIAVALKGYESVGGFDLAGGRPKPARRFVPAGSVYYFQAQGEVYLSASLVNAALTELWPEIGFGQVRIGRW